MAMTYDRGGKIVGMIENRLGEDGFFDFMRGSTPSISSAFCAWPTSNANWRRTPAARGRSFSTNWLYGKGMTDWSVEKVHVEEWSPSSGQWRAAKLGRRTTSIAICWPPCEASRRRRASVSRHGHVAAESRVHGGDRRRLLARRQRQLSGAGSRHAASPRAASSQDPPAHVKMLPGNCVRV